MSILSFDHISTSQASFNNIGIDSCECQIKLSFAKMCPPRMVWLEDKTGVASSKTTTDKSTLQIDMQNHKDGIYYLQVYINYKDDLYESYLCGREIVIKKEDGQVNLLICPIFIWNKHLLNNKNLIFSLPTPIEDCNLDVLKLAKFITMKAKNKYEQIFLVHDWIAENLYYDCDSIREKRQNGSGTNRTISQILKTKKCVCQGYSDLAIVLLSSLGVKCEGILCYSLGASAEGTWARHSNRTADLNHVITRAHDGKRWIYMDITWDSLNKFENGTFVKSPRVRPSHKYFDITLELLSSTHKFVKK